MFSNFDKHDKIFNKRHPNNFRRLVGVTELFQLTSIVDFVFSFSKETLFITQEGITRQLNKFTQIYGAFWAPAKRNHYS